MNKKKVLVGVVCTVCADLEVLTQHLTVERIPQSQLMRLVKKQKRNY